MTLLLSFVIVFVLVPMLWNANMKLPYKFGTVLAFVGFAASLITKTSHGEAFGYAVVEALLASIFYFIIGLAIGAIVAGIKKLFVRSNNDTD